MRSANHVSGHCSNGMSDVPDNQSAVGSPGSPARFPAGPHKRAKSAKTRSLLPVFDAVTSRALAAPASHCAGAGAVI